MFSRTMRCTEPLPRISEETFDFERFQPSGRPSLIAVARERDAERRQSQHL